MQATDENCTSWSCNYIYVPSLQYMCTKHCSTRFKYMCTYKAQGWINMCNYSWYRRRPKYKIKSLSPDPVQLNYCIVYHCYVLYWISYCLNQLQLVQHHWLLYNVYRKFQYMCTNIAVQVYSPVEIQKYW